MAMRLRVLASTPTVRLLDENRRHFDVVAEQMTARVQLVAEGVTTLAERLDPSSATCAKRSWAPSASSARRSGSRTPKQSGDGVSRCRSFTRRAQP
jgi:hypothetical protein